MISGMMTKSQRFLHGAAGTVMALFLATLGLVALRLALTPRVPAGNAPLRAAGFLLFGLAAVATVVQMRFRRQIISAFQYDGIAFRFRTLGGTRQEVHQLADISSVEEARGRSQGIGYRIRLRDGRSVFLPYSTENATEAATRLRGDLQLLRNDE